MRHYRSILLIIYLICILVIFIIIPLLKPNNQFDGLQRKLPRQSSSWNIDLPVLIQPAVLKLNSIILMCVTSAPHNLNRRQAIRETWGTTSSIQVVFLLGVSANHNARELQYDINFEAQAYGDVLQNNFVDNYRNLTLKSIALVQWAKKSRWPARRVVVKTDDDVFIHTPRLLSYLDHFTDGNLYGRQLTNAKPLRCRKAVCNHTEVTKDEYFPDTYPPYLQGLFYIFSETALNRIHEHMFDPAFLFIEDLYITGLVAGRAGVERCAMPKENVINSEKPDHRTLYRLKKDLLVQHHCDPTKLRQYWKHIHS